MANRIRLDRISHRQLGTSNGCRDHTVLPYAGSVVRPARREPLTDQAIRPAITLRARRCRVHRIPSRVRDDRDTPLFRGGTGRAGSADLPDGLSEIFFRTGLDDPNRVEIAARKPLFAQRWRRSFSALRGLLQHLADRHSRQPARTERTSTRPASLPRITPPE